MTTLTLQEMTLINGGSQETYEAGKAAGQKVRDILDDAALAYTIVSIAVLLIFKIKV